jgi:hypothetical protein
MIYLTKKEKEDVQEFMRQYGGQFVITESDHYKDNAMPSELAQSIAGSVTER